MARTLILRKPEYLPWAFMRVALVFTAALGALIVPIVLAFTWTGLDIGEYLVLAGVVVAGLLFIFFCKVALDQQREYIRLINDGMTGAGKITSHKIVKTRSRKRSRLEHGPYYVYSTSIHYEGYVECSTVYGPRIYPFRSISADAGYDKFASPDFQPEIIYLAGQPEYAAYLPKSREIISRTIKRSVWLFICSYILVMIVTLHSVFISGPILFTYNREPWWGGFTVIPIFLIIYIPLSRWIADRTK